MGRLGRQRPVLAAAGNLISMLWREFAKVEPELAERGWALMAQEHGYTFLATVRRDGSPRVHPIVPIRSDHGLVLAVKRGSLKLADLRREPRFVLHASVVPPEDQEFSLRGIAHEVRGEQARRTVTAGWGEDTPVDVMVLFDVEVVEVGWATWPAHGTPIRKRWRATES